MYELKTPFKGTIFVIDEFTIYFIEPSAFLQNQLIYI